MISIDEIRLISDLMSAGKILTSCHSKDIIRNNYYSFKCINRSLERIYHRTVLIEDSIVDRDLFSYSQKKNNNSEIKDLINFIKLNKDIFQRINRNYQYQLIFNRFKFYPFDDIKTYNEKTFIDIVLSYFNTCGDAEYKIAKKYFDEKRIHISNSNNYSGYFEQLMCISSGFIFLTSPDYDTHALCCLVHELGHAIDSERFLFKQQKKNFLFSDFFAEVPSITYELGLYEYLFNNHIDADNAMIYKNNRYYSLKLLLSNLVPSIDKTLDNYNVNKTLDKNTYFYPLRLNINYVLGYYISLHFEMLRRGDIDLYSKVFNNFMTSRKEATLEELIEKIGIDMEDFECSSQIFPLIKETTSYLRKRYNYL